MLHTIFRTGLVAVRLLAAWLLMCWALTAGAAEPALAPDTKAEVPLIIGNRTIHVFRAALGPFSAAERAQGARQRIEQVLGEAGEGWSSVKPMPQGIAVAIDGKTLFYVLPGDARELAGETPGDLANQASRTLQKVWSESRERRDPDINLRALLRVLLATALLLAALAAIFRSSRWIQTRLNQFTEKRLPSLSKRFLGSKISASLPALARRLSALLAWLLSLAALFLFLSFSLDQFVFTRPAGENLSQSISQLLIQGLSGLTDSLPGIFIAVLIFLAASGATRISAEFFDYVSRQPVGSGLLNVHTAPATRRIVNACLWLFALAMAYPYLPGSHTEAFRGLSVMLGLMVSIGASGLLGQIASGVMLVYTNALLVGEYVRIQDSEGTVTDIGTFVTRLRTDLGEEISLPNTLVLTNVTRNFSRATPAGGLLLDCAITIGYDTPWRQVHALLLEAAGQIPEILPTPAPLVVQSALSDYYVCYKLVFSIATDQPGRRGRICGNLHAAIQDAFNHHGVQIMSPHYFADPASAKVVPEAAWYAPPAKGPEQS